MMLRIALRIRLKISRKFQRNKPKISRTRSKVSLIRTQERAIPRLRERSAARKLKAQDVRIAWVRLSGSA